MKTLKNIKKDILPKSGAGAWGTDELTNTYKRDTPGQSVNEDAQCGLFSYDQIKDLEKFADRLLKKYDVDVGFTRHFADRMSDSRNKPCIKISELQDLFKKIESQKAEKIKRHGDGEAVIVDIQKDLNLPIVIRYNRGEFEVVLKTIMRKKNFMTSDDKIKIESFGDYIKTL